MTHQYPSRDIAVSSAASRLSQTDSSSYRSAMRRHAGAVTIVSTGSPGHRTGLVATAVCSLSDDPPMLVVCVNRNASGHAAIRSNGTFCVNLLSANQEEIASVFSGQRGLAGEARFDTQWSLLSTGAPALKGALANLDCRLIEEREFSTHSVFIGQVQTISTSDGQQPLMYFDGSFRALAHKGLAAAV